MDRIDLDEMEQVLDTDIMGSILKQVVEKLNEIIDWINSQ